LTALTTITRSNQILIYPHLQRKARVVLEKDIIKLTPCADAAVSRIDSGEHLGGGRKLEQVEIGASAD
jgi:hypothetical protein